MKWREIEDYNPLRDERVVLVSYYWETNKDLLLWGIGNYSERKGRLLVTDTKGVEWTAVGCLPDRLPIITHFCNVLSPQVTNTYIDPRDDQTYKTVELNGKIWMAQNLNYNVGKGCWFYEDNPKNGEKYGRLYTWEAAKKACPLGWRLPTDTEWREMAKMYGGADDDASDGGKGAYEALIKGGSSGFAALLGGYRDTDGSYYCLGVLGVYWGGTEKDTQLACTYYFYSNAGKLIRYGYPKSWGFACRCVKI